MFYLKCSLLSHSELDILTSLKADKLMNPTAGSVSLMACICEPKS